VKKNNEVRYIAIEGVIGVGKTSLATLLSKKLKAKLILEKYETNPFLGKFYEDPERYAFQTQIFFLLSRYQQQQEIFQMDLFNECVVSDYIFEKDKIFAYLNLQNDELKLYEKLVATIEKNIPAPDLVIYLQSNLERIMHNIRLRKRNIESSISEEYLHELNEAYNYFFFRYKSSPLLIVNSTEIDFVNNKKDFDMLSEAILKSNHSQIEYFNPSVTHF
jgi:deoxyadenosine/deoxycytidine kinase